MKKAITVSTFLDKRTTKHGAGVIKIVITSNRIQRLYTTKIKILETDWLKLISSISKDGLSGRVRDQNIIDIFSNLYAEKSGDGKQQEGFVVKAKRICKEIENDFSFEKFKLSFEGKIETIKTDISALDIFSYFEKKIIKMYSENRVGNASSYISSKNSLMKFISSMDNHSRLEFGVELKHKSKTEIKLPFETVTLKFLKQYEKWMLESGKSNQKNGQCDSPASFTTLGIYLRQLRAIFNDAITDKSTLNYPFGKNGYTIKKGQNVKKAISKSDILKILNHVPSSLFFEKRSYDFWVLSYLCSGMNFGDILRLQKRDINLSEGKIVFVREKTRRTNKFEKKEVRLVISKRAIEIINYWMDPTKTEYAFPFLAKTTSEIDRKKQIRQFIKVTNQWMKKIGESLDIDSKMGTYVTRHSYSTIMLQNNVPIAHISKSLGHSSITTTEAYFNSFEDEKIKEYIKFLE